jgi:hypothetical protein
MSPRERQDVRSRIVMAALSTALFEGLFGATAPIPVGSLT